MCELESHERVARAQQRGVSGGVCLRAGMRLDVGVLGAEQRLGPVDRQLLGDVDELAAAVVAPAGIALGVFVGQHRALRLEHRDRHEVLGGDHLERALLALELQIEYLGDLGIDFADRGVEVVGRKLGHASNATSGGGGCTAIISARAARAATRCARGCQAARAFVRLCGSRRISAPGRPERRRVGSQPGSCAQITARSCRAQVTRAAKPASASQESCSATELGLS